jgi:SagB-type dehydrogenase family enzyme
MCISAIPARSATSTSRRVRFTVGLRSGVAVEATPDGAFLRHPWGTISLQARPEVCVALAALCVNELDDAAVVQLIADGRPRNDPQVTTGLTQLDIVLSKLPLLVTHGVSDGANTVVTVEPISDKAPGLKGQPLPADSNLWLDRFAYLRRRSEVPGLCLESPLALHRARLGHMLVPLIARIAAAPITIDEIVHERELAAIELLAAAGLIRAGRSEDIEDERLATWSFHDLLFHARSRPGRSDDLFGAYFRHRDRLAAQPALPPAGPGPTIDLPSPQFAEVVGCERSLTEVIESRSSVRKYGDGPLTLTQVGHLLYRSARMRRVVPVHSVGSYDGADHPYPTGGLAGDLELYLSVARCTGLAPGIYHYESAAHQLRLVNEAGAAAPLLAAARMATAGVIEPQVLLTITSRFARTAWKYEAIAYALTLKHVGALLQTVYLVATSMGLGPCALGSGDADWAARAFGLDWLVESSVGELALGSRAEPVMWVDEFTDLVGEARATRS